MIATPISNGFASAAGVKHFIAVELTIAVDLTLEEMKPARAVRVAWGRIIPDYCSRAQVALISETVLDENVNGRMDRTWTRPP